MKTTHPEIPSRRLGCIRWPSVLWMGCMGMSEFYGTRDDEQSIRVIHRSIEMGMDFLDTAGHVYGIGGQ